jgi:N-acetylglucosaminyldiphosphoundecaprenol N-acetyl-beta-D-mannosaminyltransferase
MNVDHVVGLRDNERFRSAYNDAAVRVADGMPVVVTAKLLGLRVPGRITGADLMSALIAEAWRLQLSVAIVGGAPEVNERALENLRLTYPGLDVTGWSPYGFDPDRAAEIANRLRALAPRVVFVCFGAPRSEIWVAEHRYLLPSGVLVCAGAGVDFLAGAKKRAPAWIQRSGLEWLYRLLLEPSRLWRRYLVRDLAFVPIALRELWGRRSRRATETSPRDASSDGEPAVESPSA